MTTNEAIKIALKIKKEDFLNDKLSTNKRTAIEHLESKGYTIDGTHEWGKSVMIINPQTKKSLVVSKDYNNRTWIFFKAMSVDHHTHYTYKDLLEKFDFENFLNKPEAIHESRPRTKVEQYKSLKSNKDLYQRITDHNLEKVEKLKEELERELKAFEYYTESIKKAEQEMKDLLK